jgi:hypothetical protein
MLVSKKYIQVRLYRICTNYQQKQEIKKPNSQTLLPNLENHKSVLFPFRLKTNGNKSQKRDTVRKHHRTCTSDHLEVVRVVLSDSLGSNCAILGVPNDSSLYSTVEGIKVSKERVLNGESVLRSKQRVKGIVDALVRVLTFTPHSGKDSGGGSVGSNKGVHDIGC